MVTSARLRGGRAAGVAWIGAIVIGLFGPWLPVGVAAQDPSHGPLTYEEGSPLHRISYTARMEDAAVAPRGSLVAGLSLGISNIFEQDSSTTHVLFLDLERLVSSLTLRWGVSSRMEVGGRVMLETTGGGVLDGLILGFHNRLGFGQANRERFPAGAYAQQLRDGAGTTFLDVPAGTLAFEEARVFGKAELASSDDRRSVLSLRVEARLPGGSNRVAAERADLALMTLGRLGFGGWYVHGLLGASTIRTSPELEPILRDASAFLALAVERSFGGFSGVAQFHVQSPVLESFDHRELDRSPTNLVLGLSGALGDRWSWDASFQEDLPSDTPAVDFTLGLRLSRRW